MNNLNPENIPTDIFDWLEKYRFSTLNEEQQKKVLNYFSEEEYDELHKNSLALRSIDKPLSTGIASERKQLLVAHFDKNHQKKKRVFVFTHSLWKVAASVLLLACGWTLNYFIPGKTTPDRGLVTMIDTVYLNKEIISDPLKIYDTVYIQKKSNGVSGRKDPYTIYTGNHVKTIKENNRDINLDDIGSTINRQKRNSMKYDSLAKEFSVIMM